MTLKILVAEDEAARARGLRRTRLAARALRLREQELAYCRAAQLVLTRSAHDAGCLQSALPGLRTFVLPPIAHVREFAGIETESQAGAPVVLFSGALDRDRNVRAALWLCRDIWPRVRAGCPQAELQLVGANPGPEVRALVQDCFPLLASLCINLQRKRRRTVS